MTQPPDPGPWSAPNPGYQPHPPPVPQYGPHYGPQYVYQPYGYQPPARPRSNRFLSTWVIGLSAAMVPAQLIANLVGLSAGPIALFPQIDPENPYGFSPAFYSDMMRAMLPIQLAGMLQMAVQVGVWVATSMWLSIAYANATAVGRAPRRHSQVWVWIAWIIPIVNFWFPKQVVDDCLRGTETALTNQPPQAIRTRTGLWWGLYIAASVTEGVAVEVALLVPSRAVAAGFLAVASGLYITALVLWIKVVRRVTAIQERLAQAHG